MGKKLSWLNREALCSLLSSCMWLAEVTTALQMRKTFSETFVEILKASRFSLSYWWNPAASAFIDFPIQSWRFNLEASFWVNRVQRHANLTLVLVNVNVYLTERRIYGNGKVWNRAMFQKRMKNKTQPTQPSEEEKENEMLHHNKFMIRNSNGFNYKFVISQSSDFSNSYLSSPKF